MAKQSTDPSLSELLELSADLEVQEEDTETDREFPLLVKFSADLPVFSAGSEEPTEYTREVLFRPAMGWEDDLFRVKTKTAEARLKNISTLLSMCTVRMGSKVRPNPGADHDLENPTFFLKEWENTLSSLRMAALIRLRQASVSDTFRFTGVCPLCKKPTPRLAYNLSNCPETPVSISRNPKGGWEQETDLDGHKIVWAPLLSKDEHAMSAITEKFADKQDSAILLLFVKSVDGVVPTLRTFQRFSSSQRSRLKELFQYGGIDTIVSNTCSNTECGIEYQFPLPVLSPTFFSL
jgi:hypothetical protein